MPDNQIKIEGNGNITIQDVNGRDINVNINETEKFEAMLKQLPDEIVLRLSEQLNQQSNNTFTNAKNIVTGNIKARNIHIGDIYINESPDVPRQLTAQFPTTAPEDIIGRTNDLAQVREHLNANRQVVLVNGIGGVGKTTLAQVYAHEYGGEYKHVAWINCLSQDFAADVVQTANLLQNLRMDATGKDPKTLCLEVLNRFSNLDAPCLLVIDNAERDISEYAQYLPQSPNRHVLMTSRQRFDSRHFKELSLGFLSPEDAELLFLEHYKRDHITQENIRELVEMVDCHTLTIEILAKTAQKQRTQMSQLREALSIDLKTPVSIEHNNDQKIERVTSYLVSIFNLSQLTPDELWLMQQFTCLPPEFHDYDTLLELIQPEASKRSDIFSETLEDLVDKGWLLSKGEQYKMHRIIGEVTAQTQPPSVVDVLHLIENVTNKLNDENANHNPVKTFPWIPFGEAIVNQFEDNDAPKIAVLQNNLALVLQDLGDYEGAKVLLEKAMHSDEQNFGEQHPTTAIRYSNLANVLRELGDYNEARKLLKKAVEIGEQSLGETHPSTTIYYTSLALVMKALGDYESAKVLLEKAMRSTEQNFGEQHPTTTRRYSNLALVLKDLGDYEGAKVLLQKVIISAEKNYGEEHPQTAIYYSNLATVLKALGDYEGAKKLLEKAMHSDEQNFGEQHPKTAIRYSNLATVLKALGDYEGAKKLLEKGIISAEKNYGKEHPQTAIYYSNLATVLKALGDYEGAKKLLEKTMKSMKQNFGENHPNTAQSYSNLALVLQDLGDYEGAKALLEKAMYSDEQNFGEQHPTTAIRYSNLATVLQDLGDYEGAKALLEKAMHSAEQNFGEQHPTTAIRYSNLAAVYINLNETKKAVDLLEKSYSICYNVFGAAHPRTKNVQEWLDIYKPKS